MTKPSYHSTWCKIQHNHAKKISDHGTRIQYYCAFTGCSLYQLDQACVAYGDGHNVRWTKGSIYMYAHNKCTPKMDRLTVLANTMGVDQDWLLGYGSSRLHTYKRVRRR